MRRGAIAVVRPVSNVVRLALAFAALVAQASVPALGRDCERACAATVAHGCCSAHVASPVDSCPQDAGAAAVASDGGCCQAGVAGATGTTGATGDADDPCRCRLEPRNDGSLPGHRQSSPRFSGDDAAVLPGTAPAPAPATIAVSREYLAASLSIPIRPTRILFGVWRN
jgi:hypothetical protein